MDGRTHSAEEEPRTGSAVYLGKETPEGFVSTRSIIVNPGAMWDRIQLEHSAWQYIEESLQPEVDRLRKMATGLIERMHRARSILHKDENSQWLMLDATKEEAVLKGGE